jgi:predicted metal-dependent hydrolase
VTAVGRGPAAGPGRAAPPAGAPDVAPRRTVVQGGRAKAFRPLPVEDRRRAFAAGVTAYERGDFFEAHELLEPAWMGTDDPGERDLDQGLIKLAAAFVHGVRGNPRGIARNLEGARERLATAVGTSAERDSGLDVARLVAAIDDRLARLAAAPDDPSIEPPALPWTDH